MFTFTPPVLTGASCNRGHYRRMSDDIGWRLKMTAEVGQFDPETELIEVSVDLFIASMASEEGKERAYLDHLRRAQAHLTGLFWMPRSRVPRLAAHFPWDDPQVGQMLRPALGLLYVDFPWDPLLFGRTIMSSRSLGPNGAYTSNFPYAPSLRPMLVAVVGHVDIASSTDL